MKKYDLAVIGSGAGLMLIEAALQNNLKCAIIEKSKFGGTCLTQGCIPSKMLVYPADLIREAQRADKVGLEYAAPKIDWDKIAGRMRKQIDFHERIEKSLFSAANLTVYKGTGEFTGPQTMRVLNNGVYSDEFESSKFIIAAGARSFVPPIPGLEETGYLVYETFFDIKFPSAPWKSLVIIGCGAIGAEFAHIFSSMGTKVTVVEMNERILPAEEEEISEFVKKQFGAYNIDVLTGARAVSVSKNGSGKKVVVENIASGNKTNIDCDEIFVASGIRSNSDLLNLGKTNVQADSKGWIVTNGYLETTQKNIWALGDINGKYQFRHKANLEAEILTHNLFIHEKQKEMDYNTVPWAIFTSPQVAHVGITEREAKSKGLKYWVGRNFYSEVAGGIAMGYSSRDSDNGFVKILVGEEKKILGVHITGPYASILLQPFVYIMASGQKCQKSKRPLNFGMIKLPELRIMCPELGTYTPIVESMVIHPSLNELTAWVIDRIDWEDENG